ncbi:MAG: PD-(D/E)XK nuclease family protein, partial [Anaeromyxobacteraceae bacterium]|nr:PD-(D/E)XK nuclease family protein [Anaeromyxobacteraceae bacterium]
VKGSLEQAEADPESGAADDSALWNHAAAVARTLEQLLIARPTGELLTQQVLMQLHAMAVGSGSDLAAFGGEAGRPALASSPAAVTTPCASVVWWGFVLDADPGPAPEPWTGAEREALLRAGVALPAPGERRDVEAEGWRQPLLSARERAVLVRWRLSGADPIAPHSFFDELSTRAADGALDACTVTSERLLAATATSAPWSAATASVAPQGLMAQRAAWKVPPETLVPRGRLSSSSLEKYLGCPFAWALRYQADLFPGSGVDLPSGGQLLGSFAHEILQDMLCGPAKLAWSKAKPEDARAWAAAAFDERVGLRAAPLVRRGGEVELDRARTLVADAAAALVKFLKGSGWKPVDAEREVSGAFSKLPAYGYVDLVVEKDGAEAILDLKLSGLGYRQTELEEGRALQTALYASLLKKGGKGLPPSGFFVLEDGQFLTTEPQAFPGATVVEGPGSQATLDGSVEGFRYWTKVLAKGVLPVLHEQLDWEPAVASAAGPPPDEDSLARRKPPCRYCDYAAVCVPPAIVDEEVSP